MSSDGLFPHKDSMETHPMLLIPRPFLTLTPRRQSADVCIPNLNDDDKRFALDKDPSLLSEGCFLGR